jgi:hypothetical protein
MPSERDPAESGPLSNRPPAWRRRHLGPAYAGWPAAAAGRFADDDLLSIVRHRSTDAPAGDLVHCDESYSVQPGTSAWAEFGGKTS